MNKIFLGLIFMLIFLPQASFAASAQQTACIQQVDEQANAFFQQQGQERGAFIKANPDLIAKQDEIGKWGASHKDGKVHPGDTSPRPPDLTPQESNTFGAFVEKQRTDGHIFIQKLNQQRQACLNL